MDTFLTKYSDSGHSIWEFTGNLFMSTENGGANTSKNMMCFLAILKLILKFYYNKGKYGCIFFSVHRTMFSQCIKMCKVFCHNWIWHCTALHSPHILVSAQTVPNTHQCCCFWAVSGFWGWARPLSKSELLPWWCRAGGPQNGLSQAICGLQDTSWTWLL